MKTQQPKEKLPRIHCRVCNWEGEAYVAHCRNCGSWNVKVVKEDIENEGK